MRTIVTLVCLLAGAGMARAELKVELDAREADRKLVHSRVTVSAQPGPLTLVYPRWIPGEHGPTGPIGSVAGLRVEARGKPVTWRRDPVDMYAMTVEVPPGAREVELTFDVILGAPDARHSSAVSASARLAVLNWNQVVYYPSQARSRDLKVTPSLILPAGWKMATALHPARTGGGRIEFGPVSLETLIDSPVLTGEFFRSIDLSPAGGPSHTLHLAGDSAAATEVNDLVVGYYRRLVSEAGLMLGVRPYRRYQFLLALSDHVASFGLEHHESSDNRQRERTFIEEPLRVLGASLLPHEFAHAWNGKHRRPAGLVTADFQQPVRTELLWVYEGLTSYLGEVLTARSGLRTPEQARDALALSAATLDAAPGRTWRSLADTAVAAQVVYGGPRAWRGWRRGADFYPESILIWLEADTVIRAVSGGQRSLDDFCRLFHGTGPAEPSVVPYGLDDLLRVLGELAPHDWRSFFARRIDGPTTRAPLGGIEAAGWRLAYRDQPTAFMKDGEKASKVIDLGFSLGLLLGDDGLVQDALPGAPAARAGLAPGMKVIAVNGRRFGPDLVREAVRDTARRPDLDLLVENGDYIRSHHLAYKGGARYPVLERDPARPDLLEAIFRPASTGNRR